MNVLILGSGGREHALAWKVSQSSSCNKLFIAPGNSGTSEIGQNVEINVTDFEKIKTLAINEGIEMIIVGPEDPLVNGVYEVLMSGFHTVKVSYKCHTSQSSQPTQS